MQKLASPPFFGRVFAAEMAAFTAFKAAGLLLGGYLMDALSLPARLVGGITLFFSLVVFFVWLLYFQLHPQMTTKKPSAKANLRINSGYQRLGTEYDQLEEPHSPELYYSGSEDHVAHQAGGIMGGSSSSSSSSSTGGGNSWRGGGAHSQAGGGSGRSPYSGTMFGAAAAAAPGGNHAASYGDHGRYEGQEDDDDDDDDEGYESPLDEEQPLVI